MAVDPACKIAVLARTRYRAESLALALAQQSACETLGVTNFDASFLSRFSTIVIDLEAGPEVALKLTRAITIQDAHAKVILVGLIESEENVLKMAEAGASGYVSPAASFQELISIVQCVQKGEFTCPPNITYNLFAYLSILAQEKISNASRNSPLTIRERRVLDLMSADLSNKEIAARLCISEHTVKNHVHHIFEKLGVHNRFGVSMRRSARAK
jgi:DNA-binding NarL/FixJ family response regulator